MKTKRRPHYPDGVRQDPSALLNFKRRRVRLRGRRRVGRRRVSRLFVSQRMRGIRPRCLNGMEGYREHGDKCHDNSGDCKDPPREGDTVGEALQPIVHDKPGKGYCDNDRKGHQEEKIPADEQQYPGHGSTHYLPDADLFGALHRRER